jgi:hypothetical protein
MSSTKCRYARLQGTFWRHDRTASLSLAAAGLHARAMSYAADQMTDGHVPRHLLAAFFGGAIDAAVVAELTTAGVWREVKTGHVIRDWSQHNITAEGWEAKKLAHKERMAALRAAKRAQENRNDSADVQICDRSQPDHTSITCAPVIPTPLDEGRRTKDEDEDDLRSKNRSVDVAPAGDADLCLFPTEAKAPPKPSPVRVVFDHWVQAMGRDARTKLDRKREARIKWALREYGQERAIAAIDGCRASAWHMGDNDRGKAFNDLTLIFRDAAHIEDFLEPQKRGARRGSGFEPPTSHDRFTATPITDDLFDVESA